MLRLPGCGRESRILHSMLSFAPEEHYVTGGDRAFAKNSMCAHVLAEHISQIQTGEERAQSFRMLWEVWWDVSGSSNAFRPPMLLNTDCAGGLQDGFLIQFQQMAVFKI